MFAPSSNYHSTFLVRSRISTCVIPFSRLALILSFIAVWNFAAVVRAQQEPANSKGDATKQESKETVKEKIFELPDLATEVFEADYSKGMDAWLVLDDAWKMRKDADGKPVGLSQHQKKTNYKPPFRSPGHIALVKECSFESFVLDVKVLSTHKDYPHRDVCLFFGFKSPSEFYYVHLGKEMDPHANQIFIVNQAARTKISLTTNKGTNWDENWHDVRIIRDAKSGTIEVYFDDMEKPVMTAKDTTFGKGLIGVGSFDDTADFGALTVTPK